MTSEIRTNSLTSRAGLSTVTLTDSGPMFSGITTFVDNSGFNLGTGSSIFTPASNTLTFGTNNTEKVRVNTNGVTVTGRVDPAADNTYDLGTNSVRFRSLYAHTLYGNGSNLTGISAGTSLSGSTNNTVCTVTGANAIQGEANLTFDGTQLSVTGSGTDVLKITSTNAGDTGANLLLHHNSASPADNDIIGVISFRGDDDSGAETTFSELRVISTDVSNNSESADITFHTRSAGTFGERLRITSSGQMGLGTSPSNLFHIKDTSNSAMMRLESNSYSSYIAQIQSNNNVGNGSEAGNLYLRGQSGVQMSGNGGTATQFDLDGTALSITGTTDGVLNLDTSDSRGSFIRFKQGGATEAWVGCGNGLSLGGTTTLALRSDADIRIRTGTEEHATITTEGYLAVKGQAGNWIYNNHPANYNFHQFSSSRNGDWMMQFRQEHHNGLGFNMRVNNNNANEAIALYRENQSNYGFKVYNTGNVQNINNSYGSLSDVSLKENIVDAKSQWNDIKGIKVRNFNLKSDNDKVKMLGVVAQELETVSPKLVFEDKDGVKGVHYSVLYMKAIKALQEAMTRIETLEQDNIALRARVTNLEGN